MSYPLILEESDMAAFVYRNKLVEIDWDNKRMKDGYWQVRVSDRSHRWRWEFVYRVVMEIQIGRAFRKGETTHHKDLNKENDADWNLKLYPNSGRHLAEHARLRHEAALTRKAEAEGVVA